MERGRKRSVRAAESLAGLFDPEASARVREEDLKSLSKNASFEGRSVRGKVLRTPAGGRRIYEARDVHRIRDRRRAVGFQPAYLALDRQARLARLRSWDAGGRSGTAGRDALFHAGFERGGPAPA